MPIILWAMYHGLSIIEDSQYRLLLPAPPSLFEATKKFKNSNITFCAMI